LEHWWWDFATATSVMGAARDAADLGLSDTDVVAIAPAWIGVPTVVGTEAALLPAKIEWDGGRLYAPTHVPDSLRGDYVSVRGSALGHQLETRQLLSPEWSERDLVAGAVVLMPLCSVSELAARAHALQWGVMYPMVERVANKAIRGALTAVQRELDLSVPLFDEETVAQMVSDYVLGKRVERMLNRATARYTYAKVEPYTAMRVAVRRDLREAVYVSLGDAYRGSMIREFARSTGLDDPNRVAQELSALKAKVVTPEAAAIALDLPRAIRLAHSDR